MYVKEETNDKDRVNSENCKQHKNNESRSIKSPDVTLNAIKNSLKKRQKVILVGFGTFSVLERRARNGRNPKTGDVITIARQKTPKFTAGKSLKDAIK